MNIRELAGLQIDEYELVNLIGQGGMSAVYRAYQEELERHVAVKILADELAEQGDYITRFRQEAKMAASLEHPHIIPVYDYGVHDKLSYVVMRLLHATLTDRIYSVERMSMNDILTMLESIARALDYAHSRGIVHRDVKPSNIMFDERGIAYLVDFGIATAMQTDLDMTGEHYVMGTPSYMSPEQWRDDPVSPSVDQYALAIVMFQTLTGKLPFSADTPSQLMYKHLNDAAPLATTINPQLPAAAAEVLWRGMSKNPADRYPLISNFSNALRQALTSPGAPAPSSYAPRQQSVKPTHPSQPPVQQTPPPRKKQREAGSATLMVRVAQGGMIGVGLLFLLVIVIVVGGLMLFAPDPQPSPTPNPEETRAVLRPTEEPLVVLTSRGEPTTAITVSGAIITPSIGFVGLDAENARELTTLYPISPIPVRDAVYSPDGRMIAAAHGDGLIRLWRAGESTPPVELAGHTDVVSALVFNSDGSLIASAARDNTVRLWDTRTGQALGAIESHTAAVRDVAFHPAGSFLASASEDGTVKIWDLSTGQLYRTIEADPGRVLAVAFSPEGGNTLATGGRNGIVSLWNAETGALLSTLQGHTEEIRSIAFSPDGQWVASSSTDDSIIIWRRDNGQRLQTLTGHGRDVFVITFNPDSQILASGGRDNNIRLWDVMTGKELVNLTGHGGWVLGLSFSPDGATLVSGSGDGSIRLWGVR